jgi:hypothetical protein
MAENKLMKKTKESYLKQSKNQKIEIFTANTLQLTKQTTVVGVHMHSRLITHF